MQLEKLAQALPLHRADCTQHVCSIKVAQENRTIQARFYNLHAACTGKALRQTLTFLSRQGQKKTVREKRAFIIVYSHSKEKNTPDGFQEIHADRRHHLSLSSMQRHPYVSQKGPYTRAHTLFFTARITKKHKNRRC